MMPRLNIGTKVVLAVTLAVFALSLSMQFEPQGQAYGLHNSWPFWTLGFIAAVVIEVWTRRNP